MMAAPTPELSSKISFIAAPEDLTAPILTEILQNHCGTSHLSVEAVRTAPISSAILSRVVEVVVDVDQDDDDTSHTTKRYIAKFLRSSLPLSEMFRVEATFYEQYANSLPHSIFSTPCYVASGPCFLIMEKLEAITSYTLLETCPLQLIPTVLCRLAHFHAHYWTNDSAMEAYYVDLSHAAGIGSALTGQQKQDLFPLAYSKFSYQSEAFSDVCRRLSTLDLCLLHDRVHSFRPTMIHGDFHVGNLLFSDSDDEIFLIDWATCGAGNPMQELVFFLVVSTKNATLSEIQSQWLPLYHRELLSYNKQIEVSLEDLWNHLSDCLVNQLVILVCYDNVSRQLIAEQACDQGAIQMFHMHFDNCNRRCAETLLELGEFPLLPPSVRSDESASASALDARLLTEI